MSVIAFIAFLFLVVTLVAHKYDKGKKKVWNHIANGDINPAEMSEDNFTSTPDKDTRETFRQLANR